LAPASSACQCFNCHFIILLAFGRPGTLTFNPAPVIWMVFSWSRSFTN
jgi:hypothetical protein